MTNSVTVEELVQTLDIEFAYGEEFKERKITSSEVARPGLILTGYHEFYVYDRIQLIGKTEINYINSKTSEERTEIFKVLCREETPAIVIARQIPVPKELIPIAQACRIPILTARSKTSRVLANLTNYLEGKLAERLSKHGVFVEVFGLGVLLVGASGVGKSETALELIQRGHRLIADDRVELYMIDELTLIGEAPEILRHFLEIRGLGIIDVMSLYGVAATRLSKKLELIIELILDDGTHEYDRLGSQRETVQIFEVNVPKIKLPVKTGRNLAVIIESAAMNYRAQVMGFDATESFNSKLDALIAKNQQEDM
ncbi:HPr(Ser) kinase/phosphatase [Fundicoccus culcitae]|uniref:HPr kinase/phosphorylase n=1 Tax=Fundicoccus culcitae TaxID=2969821 RepID=A0ABY5P2I7_9LACT|nr:HPr(Ser) kinase/phosphatase [Fundicoccus culcitae]UUX32922.1 HPr(Ser) kinase/phosphatase [Fundicoccus culcitae]